MPRKLSTKLKTELKPGTVVVFDSAGNYPVAEAGVMVSLTKAEDSGDARFGNLIVSDLYQEES